MSSFDEHQQYEVPGIDDGGLGLRLTGGRATVHADGKPHRIPVGGFQATAQVSLVAIPLKSAWVHIRARIINSGTTPWLVARRARSFAIAGPRVASTSKLLSSVPSGRGVTGPTTRWVIEFHSISAAGMSPRW